MEKIIAAITVAFAAFCVIWAFIRQLNSDNEGGCSGKCGGCISKQKDESKECQGIKDERRTTNELRAVEPQPKKV